MGCIKRASFMLFQIKERAAMKIVLYCIDRISLYVNKVHTGLDMMWIMCFSDYLNFSFSILVERKTMSHFNGNLKLNCHAGKNRNVEKLMN